ncbi:hypothetical protein LCGC14_1611350, partial [marine sediment metagenome]
FSDFPARKDAKNGIRGTCRICTNKVRKEWYKKNKNKINEYRHKYYANNREKIIKLKVLNNLKYRRLARLDCINHYSDNKNECECCGENHLEFLAIDHIHNNGSEERKRVKMYLPLYLKRKGFPEGYRILCHNCNASLGYYGYCPHKKED